MLTLNRNLSTVSGKLSSPQADHLKRCLELSGDDEIPTVKQDVALSLSQWMAWSRGQTWDNCPCEDYDLPNYQCPNCG
jgi:hypothetical protein